MSLIYQFDDLSASCQLIIHCYYYSFLVDQYNANVHAHNYKGLYEEEHYPIHNLDLRRQHTRDYKWWLSDHTNRERISYKYDIYIYEVYT